MTLPTSGPIGLAQIATELGLGMPLSLTDPRVLALAGKSAPPVTMPTDFYGKSAGATAAFTATGYDASGSATSNGVGGTVSCSPSIAEMGGTAPYTRTWSITSNPGGCSLSDANSPSCTVYKSYGRYSAGTATAVLQCVSADSAGHTVTTTGINARLDWSNEA